MSALRSRERLHTMTQPLPTTISAGRAARRTPPTGVATRSHKRRRRAMRRGASATEFAIVAPVFFLMIVGFLELGRALMVQQVLINASRVGARQASTTGATTTEVQNAVTNYATG